MNRKRKLETEPKVSDYIKVYNHKVSFQHPSDINKENAFEKFLDGNITDFFLNCWETKPCHFKSTIDNTCELSKLIDKKSLIDIVKKYPLTYDENFNILKYDGCDRDLWDNKDDEFLEASQLKNIFQKGYTVQFFQPQRFSDGIFYLNSSFEKYFQNLAGASAYFTPKKAQGLAPHYDDVEVFVIQTEGSKQWHLWPPNFLLPEEHSKSIPRESLPAQRFEIILNPGDILYLPRGTIHEAISLDNFSSHITISVYQKYNIKTLMKSALERLLDKAFEEDVEYRRGLPVKLNELFGSYVREITIENENNHEEVKKLKNKRKEFFEHIKFLSSNIFSKLTENLIDESSDLLIQDFVSHRLPPFELKNLDNQTSQLIQDENDIHQNAKMYMIHPSNIFAMVQEIDGVKSLLISNNRNNNRLRHMNHPSIETDRSLSENGDDGGSEDVSNTDSSEFYNNEPTDKYDEPFILQTLFRYGILFDYIKSNSLTSTYIFTPKSLESKFKSKFNLEEILDFCIQMIDSGFLVVIKP